VNSFESYIKPQLVLDPKITWRSSLILRESPLY